MKSETVLKWLRTTALVLTMGIMVSNAQKTRFSKKKKQQQQQTNGAHYFKHLDVGTCTSSNGLQGLDSNLNRAVTPDLLVRLNVTAAQLSYVGAIGSSGGLLVPLLTALFDK